MTGSEEVRRDASETGAPEVIVVGAGPVGLSVALGLARTGRRVLVLEKGPGTVEHSRAPAIWPRTQEILSDLGVLDRCLAEGLTLGRVRLWDADRGRELLTIPVEELEDVTPFPRLLILPQARTEKILLEAVQGEKSARVHFSARVVDVRQDGSGVAVEYRSHGELHRADAPFVVGCDGGGSTVRRSLSIALEGETYDTRAALADVKPGAPADLPFPRLTTRDGLAVGIRMDGDVWRLILPFGAADDRALDERVEQAAVRLFPGVSSAGGYETVWRSEFELHRRIASRFVQGRVALAGDAAHLNSPVGGQGMNAGIQDAEILVRCLLQALEADRAEPLEAYARKRRAAVEEGVNRFTDALTRVLLLGRGRAIRPALFLARQALRVGRLRRRFLLRISMIEAE